MGENANRPMSWWRACFGATLLVSIVLTVAMLLLDRTFGVVSISKLTLNDPNVRSGLFSALISVCGLLLSVFLAVLAVITSLGDERQVVRVMKEELNVYDELVHRLVGPVAVVLLVAFASIVCVVLPAPSNLPDDRGLLMLLPTVTISLALGLFVQTAQVAHLLGKVLLFKRRGPSQSDSAAAVKARLESTRIANLSRQEPSPPNDNDSRAVVVAF